MGTIRGNMKAGRYGRMVVNTDGSVTLYNVMLEDMVVVNCDLGCESGEHPFPFADRANRLDDWASQVSGDTLRNEPFYVGGKGGDVVKPGAKPTDLKALRKAAAKSDREDSMRVFGVEKA